MEFSEGWDGQKRILVILAHPDDPEFFCGATIARWAANGHLINYVLLTRGDKGAQDRSLKPDEISRMREIEQQGAARVLGVQSVRFLDYLDGYLVPDLALRKDIVRVIRQERPDILVTCDPLNFISDTHINHPDHRAAGLATLDAVFPVVPSEATVIAAAALAGADDLVLSFILIAAAGGAVIGDNVAYLLGRAGRGPVVLDQPHAENVDVVDLPAGISLLEAIVDLDRVSARSDDVGAHHHVGVGRLCTERPQLHLVILHLRQRAAVGPYQQSAELARQRGALLGRRLPPTATHGQLRHLLEVNVRQDLLVDQLLHAIHVAGGERPVGLDRVQHMFFHDRMDVVEDWYKRLDKFVRVIEQQRQPEADLDAAIAHENAFSTSLDGRSVFDGKRPLRSKNPNPKDQLDLFS